MSRNRALAIVVGLAICLASGTVARAPHADAASPDRVPTAAGAAHRIKSARLPVAFEANRGQTDARVRFLARAKGLTAFVTDEETVLTLSAPARDSDGAPATEVVRMRFVGSNPHPAVEARDDLPGKCNYFLGSDPSRWVTDAPTCAGVVLREIRPGIDLQWYGGTDGRLR